VKRPLRVEISEVILRLILLQKMTLKLTFEKFPRAYTLILYTDSAGRHFPNISWLINLQYTALTVEKFAFVYTGADSVEGLCG